jgi:hypothetical protein
LPPQTLVGTVNKNLRIAWAMLTRGTPFDP